MVQLSESATFIMLMMFDQVKELQKMRSRQFILTTSFFDIRALIVKIFDKMRIQAEFQSLNMYLKIDQKVPKIIKTDSEKLEKMLFSLI